MYNTPQRFSASSPFTYIVAPFWSNNDISNRIGNITYEVHSTEVSQSQIALVSSFISQQQQVQFNGSWMIVAKWNGVPQFERSLSIVSILLKILVLTLQVKFNPNKNQDLLL